MTSSDTGRGARRFDRAHHIEPIEARVFLATTLALGGAPTIVPDAPTNVSSAIQDRHQSEMQITVNPKNPLQIAGFEPQFEINGPVTTFDVYYSADGGANWNMTTIGGPNGLADGLGANTGRNDPTAIFDTDGRLYVAYFTSPTATASRKLVVWRDATDGGANGGAGNDDLNSLDGAYDLVIGGTGHDYAWCDYGDEPIIDEILGVEDINVGFP